MQFSCCVVISPLNHSSQFRDEWECCVIKSMTAVAQFILLELSSIMKEQTCSWDKKEVVYISFYK